MMPFATEGHITATAHLGASVAVRIPGVPRFWLTLEQARHCADGVRDVLRGTASASAWLRGQGEFGAERLPDGRVTVHHGNAAKTVVLCGNGQAEQFVAALTEALAGGAS